MLICSRNGMRWLFKAMGFYHLSIKPPHEIDNSALLPINAWRRTGNKSLSAWWRHQMQTFSALQANCAGNSPVTGEFPAQRPVTRSFDVFLDLHLNTRLSKINREAGDLRRYRAHYDVIVMWTKLSLLTYVYASLRTPWVNWPHSVEAKKLTPLHSRHCLSTN